MQTVTARGLNEFRDGVILADDAWRMARMRRARYAIRFGDIVGICLHSAAITRAALALTISTAARLAEQSQLAAFAQFGQDGCSRFAIGQTLLDLAQPRLLAFGLVEQAVDPGFEPVIQLRPDPSLFIDQWPGAIAGVRF